MLIINTFFEKTKRNSDNWSIYFRIHPSRVLIKTIKSRNWLLLLSWNHPKKIKGRIPIGVDEKHKQGGKTLRLKKKFKLNNHPGRRHI